MVTNVPASQRIRFFQCMLGIVGVSIVSYYYLSIRYFHLEILQYVAAA
jgi:hypothetical protein